MQSVVDSRVHEAVRDAGSIELLRLAEQLGLPQYEVQGAVKRLQALHLVHAYDGPGTHARATVGANVLPGRPGLTTNEQRVLRAIYHCGGHALDETVYDFEDIRFRLWSLRAVRRILFGLWRKGIVRKLWEADEAHPPYTWRGYISVVLADDAQRQAAEDRVFDMYIAGIAEHMPEEVQRRAPRRPKKATRTPARRRPRVRGPDQAKRSKAKAARPPAYLGPRSAGSPHRVRR